jgi:peroxiredoxin Q/BCP
MVRQFRKLSKLKIVRGLAWLALSLLVAAGHSGCILAQRAAEIEAAAAANSPLTGKPAIDFTLRNQDGEPVSLKDDRGEWVVLYFYPADGTPGCTCQAREFTGNLSQFHRLSAKVYGISPDTVASHREVTEQYKLKVPLLADPDRKVMEAYGAWVATRWGGRAIRSTVLIDPEGQIAYHWPEVIATGHAERVRAKLEEIRAARAPKQGKSRPTSRP